LLGRPSTTWAILPAIFPLVIFETGSSFMLMPAWMLFLPFLLPYVAGMTGTGYIVQPFIHWDRVSGTFSWADLKLWSSQSLTSE
jgi:hypothetical protein